MWIIRKDGVCLVLAVRRICGDLSLSILGFWNLVLYCNGLENSYYWTVLIKI